jgi:chromosome segregation ATPase
MEATEQNAVMSQKELMTKIHEFEAEREEMTKKLESTADAHEEAQRRLSALTSQLKEAQISSVESEKIATEERIARANAEAGLREAKSELSSMEASMASMEKLFNSQIEAMAAKESNSKEQIRSLEQEVQSLKSQIQILQQTSTIISPKQQSNERNLAVNSMDSKDTTNLLDRDTDFLERKIKDLEATRDKLSAALVLAEQKMAEGRAAKARVDSMSQELTDMRRKLAAAMELLGEKEETIEELKEDLFDVRQGYKDQLIVMANQVDRLTKKIDVLSPAAATV